MTIPTGVMPDPARPKLPPFNLPTLYHCRLSRAYPLVTSGNVTLNPYPALLLGSGIKIDACLGNLHLEAEPL